MYKLFPKSITPIIGLAAFLLQLCIAQGLATDLTDSELSRMTAQSIKAGHIDPGMFLFPVREAAPRPRILNLMKNYSTLIRVEPVLGIRYSTVGFELFHDYTPGSVLWVTPGVRLETSMPVISPMSGWWVTAWARFNKHSAFGFDGESPPEGLQIAPFNPDISYGFYTEAQEPDNGVDFDEGDGCIALMSANFDLTLGKFRSGFGPSPRSNLAFSSKGPGMTQIRLHSVFHDRIHFTWHAAELQSEVIDTAATESSYISDTGFRRDVYKKRYLCNHRFDFLFTENFRLGLYEQVIFGGRAFPLDYAIPVVPLWSVQHALGDLDNMQMGLDLEWLVSDTRIYGSLMMDEWAPYDTFDSSENHNWFSGQVGVMKVFQLFSRLIMLHGEYSWADPRAYIHRYEVNQPYHHRYPVGLWTGGNADDVFLSLQTWFDRNGCLQLSCSRSRLGKQDVLEVYGPEIPGFLDGEIQKRETIQLKYTVPVMSVLFMELQLNDVSTHRIYKDDHFTDVSLSMMVNLAY